MREQLPVLQVLVPFLAAPLCILLRNRTVVRLLALAAALVSFLIAFALLNQVLASGEPISYQMGGWAPPLGIEYRVDILNAILLVIVSGIATVVLSFGLGCEVVPLPQERQYLFYTAFLLCISGLLGIAITGDAFNIFVFVEITSLSSYALISMGRKRNALLAAFSYLVMGTIGGTFFLIGVGLLYQLTGTLNIADLSVLLQDPVVQESRSLKVALGFLVLGSSIKLAVFPLHQWLPNAYSHAPNIVSAFLAATATKVSYYVLVRTVFSIVGAGFVFGVVHLDRLLMPLSLLAIFVGSIAAIYQNDLKRLLAYSSIAQIGYMTLGLSFNSLNGLTGGLVHLLNHALMKGGLFLVVACVGYRIGSWKIEDMKGIGRRMPVTFAAFIVGGLSLIGVPLTVGFVSKWYLVIAAIEKGAFLVAALVLLGSLLAVVYVWRVVETAYFHAPTDDREIIEAPLTMLIPTWILIGGCLFFGVQTEWTAQVAQRAAAVLIGGGP